MKYLDIFLQVSIFHWVSAPSEASNSLRAERATRFERGEQHASSGASNTLRVGRGEQKKLGFTDITWFTLRFKFAQVNLHKITCRIPKGCSLVVHKEEGFKGGKLPASKSEPVSSFEKKDLRLALEKYLWIYPAFSLDGIEITLKDRIELPPTVLSARIKIFALYSGGTGIFSSFFNCFRYCRCNAAVKRVGNNKIFTKFIGRNKRRYCMSRRYLHVKIYAGCPNVQRTSEYSRKCQ